MQDSRQRTVVHQCNGRGTKAKQSGAQAGSPGEILKCKLTHSVITVLRGRAS